MANDLCLVGEGIRDCIYIISNFPGVKLPAFFSKALFPIAAPAPAFSPGKKHRTNRTYRTNAGGCFLIVSSFVLRIPGLCCFCREAAYWLGTPSPYRSSKISATMKKFPGKPFLKGSKTPIPTLPLPSCFVRKSSNLLGILRRL